MVEKNENPIEKEDALKRLSELCQKNSGIEAIDENLTEEEQEWIRRKIPNDPFGKLSEESTQEQNERVMPFQEWYTELTKKYENLHDIANQNLPNLWDSLEYELSIQKILNIKDCTLPFAGIVLGRPSSLKTVGIEMFRSWKYSFYTDNFSAKAFVSHSTAVSREKLSEIDLLPKIRNKLFLTPELSPTFTKRMTT